ncbi:MAG: hypothetical protein HY901_02995 [Deltaproteobacteria bacterium]|nr:hypothetical protein [Deltaproteobacteria bacterium]
MNRFAILMSALVVAGCTATGSSKSSNTCEAPGCVTVADCSSDDVDCVEGRCVECKVDSDCKSGPKKCDAAMGICKKCVSDSDCLELAAGAPSKLFTGLCDSDTFTCTRCMTDSDCSSLGPSMKYCANESCIGCRSDFDCVGSPMGSHCIQQYCARCQVDAECIGQPFSGCDATTGTCSMCSFDAECSQFGFGASCDPATRRCMCGGSGLGCTDIEAVTSKVYLTFVIHNEEDDAGGVSGSAPTIPDFNGDPAVFQHFANAMISFAQMLSQHGAALSFQPDWTFIEGVQKYRPSFFAELLALGSNMEVVPHAHESYVPYDEVYRRLVSLGARPQMILGGMTFNDYLKKQAWLDLNPGFVFWGAPTATINHLDDKPAPGVVYRIPPPMSVREVADLYKHVASSPLIVTPGLPSEPSLMLDAKPTGRYISPAYVFHATREFLADPTDTSVPAKWRKRIDGSKPQFGANQTAAELIAEVSQKITSAYAPLVEQGKLEHATVGRIVELYLSHEPCLDLSDGQDLGSLVAAPAR